MRQLHIALALLTAGGLAAYMATHTTAAAANDFDSRSLRTPSSTPELASTPVAAPSDDVSTPALQERPLIDEDGVVDIVRRNLRSTPKAAIVDTLVDAPIAEHRRQLLELASTIADMIPARPLAKDRALTQQIVVEASLALDQARFAHTRSLAIENWRRGLGFAHLSFSAADHGRPAIAREFANAAAVLADDLEAWLSEYESPQDWRRDRIRGRVGQTYARLGDFDTAAGFVVDAEAAEAGKVAVIVAAHSSDEDFDERLAFMKVTLPGIAFDAARDALSAAVELYGRHYDTVERRVAIEEVTRLGWAKMPIDMRVWAMAGLADKAIVHGDAAHALEWIAEARVASAGGNWRPEFRIPVDAKLVGLSFRAGDTARATAEATRLSALYDAQRDQVVNIERADALVPLAEAYVVLGDLEGAVVLYQRAISEAMVNPNSKPRAMDLVDIAVSLATVELPANSKLLTSLRAAAGRLTDPW